MLEYLTLFLIITLYSNFFLISVGGNLLVVNGQVIISNLACTYHHLTKYHNRFKFTDDN